MRFKKIVILSVCVCLVAVAAFASAPRLEKQASAATVEEYKNSISELEREQAEIEAEINQLNSEKSEQKAVRAALQKRIDNLQSQINVCSGEIADIEDRIAQLNKDIETKQEELKETEFTFKKRLRAIYMSGGATTSTLATLLSAGDLSDLLTKMQLTKSISAYDNALMNKISNDMKTIEQSKQEMVSLAEEQKSIQAVLNEKKAELNSEISKVNDQISGLANSVGSLEDKSAKIDKAIEEYETAIKNASHVGSDQRFDGGQFAWPTPGYYYITSPYGYRYHPISGLYKFHTGVDISGGGIMGKPIIAAADGEVSLATYNAGGYGNYVMVNHGTNSSGDTYVTLYAHMTRYIVYVGQKVHKGDTIGYVGSTGASTGAHLHFEIRVNGNTRNPMEYF